MKKLFGGKIFDIIPFDGGFMIANMVDKIDGKIVIGYKSVTFSNCMVQKCTANEYKQLKFGTGYNPVTFGIKNFIACNSIILDNSNIFITESNGDAKILDNDGCVQWQGTIRYKETGPSSICRLGHTVWAAFSEKNAIIRFNLRTMREELRIGGSSGDSSFSGPCGLWADQVKNTLIVCNSTENNMLEVNLKTYTVHKFHEFDEPVKKYVNIDSHELVILDSGLYML